MPSTVAASNLFQNRHCIEATSEAVGSILENRVERKPAQESTTLYSNECQVAAVADNLSKLPSPDTAKNTRGAHEAG